MGSGPPKLIPGGHRSENVLDTRPQKPAIIYKPESTKIRKIHRAITNQEFRFRSGGSDFEVEAAADGGVRANLVVCDLKVGRMHGIALQCLLGFESAVQH